MSTSSAGSSTGATLTDALGTLQETGLASGINYDEIIEAELAVDEEPMTNMEDEIEGLETEDSTLGTIQDDLQTVANDALSLSDVTLFANSQTVSSTDSALVSATPTGSLGAVIGASTISVTQLASAASRTYTYASPSSSTTITIDGESLTVSAGESAASVASAINGSNSYDVYATTATDSSGGTELVLSSRSTGDQTSGYIDVEGADGTLTENTALASAGQDAEYSINGGATQSSTSDKISGALPGVALTLSGVTGSTPVTIDASNPAPSTTAIISEVEQFVSDYNSALEAIESDIDTAPASESDSTDYDPNSGSLFGDDELENLLSDMRDSLSESYGSGSSLYTTLASIGISTGESTGSMSSNSVAGELTIDTTTLTDAIESDPTEVKSLLQTWSTSFQTVVNNAASSTTGALATRVSGNGDLISNLQNQYDSMQTLYAQEEKTMEEEWANTEAALEDLDDQKSSLTSFATELENETSSSD
jgi:flagellar hook-associated protein 2